MTIADLKQRNNKVVLLPFNKAEKLWDDLTASEKRAVQKVAKDAPYYTGFFVIEGKKGWEQIYAFDGISPYPWRPLAEVRK